MLGITSVEKLARDSERLNVLRDYLAATDTNYIEKAIIEVIVGKKEVNNDVETL